MINTLLGLVSFLVLRFKERRELALENLALRQLAVLKRPNVSSTFKAKIASSG
jgi:hypothetical protein